MGVNEDLGISETGQDLETEAKIREIFGEDAQFIESSGYFECVPGPITPDHLVYSRAYPFTDELTQENADAYRAKHGFAPKVLIYGDRVYGLGVTEKNAGSGSSFRSGWGTGA